MSIGRLDWVHYNCFICIYLPIVSQLELWICWFHIANPFQAKQHKCCGQNDSNLTFQQFILFAKYSPIAKLNDGIFSSIFYPNCSSYLTSKYGQLCMLSQGLSNLFVQKRRCCLFCWNNAIIHQSTAHFIISIMVHCIQLNNSYNPYLCYRL